MVHLMKDFIKISQLIHKIVHLPRNVNFVADAGSQYLLNVILNHIIVDISLYGKKFLLNY